MSYLKIFLITAFVIPSFIFADDERLENSSSEPDYAFMMSGCSQFTDKEECHGAIFAIGIVKLIVALPMGLNRFIEFLN